jgi:hypothetical protein
MAPAIGRIGQGAATAALSLFQRPHQFLARPLAHLAQACNIDLHVVHIAGENNPADDYTICSGFKRWNDNDLATLVKPIA